MRLVAKNYSATSKQGEREGVAVGGLINPLGAPTVLYELNTKEKWHTGVFSSQHVHTMTSTLPTGILASNISYFAFVYPI